MTLTLSHRSESTHDNPCSLCVCRPAAAPCPQVPAVKRTVERFVFQIKVFLTGD